MICKLLLLDPCLARDTPVSVAIVNDWLALSMEIIWRPWAHQVDRYELELKSETSANV